VSIGEGLLIAPTVEKIALTIDDDHRVLAAVEEIDAITPIDADPAMS
jgi:hypothetical protein